MLASMQACMTTCLYLICNKARFRRILLRNLGNPIWWPRKGSPRSTPTAMGIPEERNGERGKRNTKRWDQRERPKAG